MLPLNLLVFIKKDSKDSQNLAYLLRAQVCLKCLKLSETLNISLANPQLLPKDLDISKLRHNRKLDFYIFAKLTGQDNRARDFLASYIEDNDENSINLLSQDKYEDFCKNLTDTNRKYMASKALGLDPQKILSSEEINRFRNHSRIEALFAIIVVFILILSVLYALIGVYRTLVDLYKYLTVQDVYLDVNEFKAEEIPIIDELKAKMEDSHTLEEEIAASKTDDSSFWDPIKTIWLFVSLSWLSLFIVLAVGGIMVYFSLSNEIYQTFVIQTAVYIINIIILFHYLPKLLNLPDDTPKFTLCHYLGLKGRWYTYLSQAFMGYGTLLITAVFSSWLFQHLTGHEPISSNRILIQLITSGNLFEYIAVYALLLMAPFYEELLFRGLLFGGTRTTFSPILAASFSSIYFALVHGDPQVTLSLLSMGLVLCWLYQYSKSIWPSILCHYLWNFSVVMYMNYLLFN